MAPLLPLLLLAACQAGDDPLVLSRLSGHGAGVGGLSLRAAGGLSAEAEITVWSRADADSDWVEAEVLTSGGEDRLEVALVADNSGSEEGYLEPMQAAVDDFGQAVLARDLGDRVGLVRVSTESQVVLPLSDDPAAWTAAVDGLFIANGWTALWDGVRLGNEVLEDGAGVSAAGGAEVCLDQARRSVVVFTDGQENNSADEHETSYDGDGIDSTLGDLTQLAVLGVPTPLYTIGIGDGVDAVALEALAEATGGAYAAVEDYTGLADTLTATAESLSDEVPVCFEVATCTDQEGRVLVVDGEERWEVVFDLPALCGCTRTRGYWSTHPEVWPLDSVELGGAAYTQEECLDFLGSATGGDKSLQMAAQLIAAKLNVAAGAADGEIAETIEAADAWLAVHGVGEGARSWGEDGEEIKDALDAWNNGETGPGHCD